MRCTVNKTSNTEVSVVMLETDCCTFVLGLTTGLNIYRPNYVASGCTKQHRNSGCWKPPLGVLTFRMAAKRFVIIFLSPFGRNLGKFTKQTATASCRIFQVSQFIVTVPVDTIQGYRKRWMGFETAISYKVLDGFTRLAS